MAYREVANRLINYVINNYSSDYQNAIQLYLPSCYLYRTAVELIIKETWLYDVDINNHVCLETLDKQKHSLSGMFGKIKKWIYKTYDDKNDIDKKAFLDEVEKYCNNLQSYDRDAKKFRYPCNNKMNVYFDQFIELDICNVKEYMERLVSSLECVSLELNSRKQCDFLL